jgi:hypothetical protein
MTGSRNSNKRTGRSGRALVILQTGYTYVADVDIDHGLVHCTDVRLRLGRGEDAWYRPVADRVWPARELREVRWLEDRAAA